MVSLIVKDVPNMKRGFFFFRTSQLPSNTVFIDIPTLYRTNTTAVPAALLIFENLIWRPKATQKMHSGIFFEGKKKTFSGRTASWLPFISPLLELDDLLFKKRSHQTVAKTVIHIWQEVLDSDQSLPPPLCIRGIWGAWIISKGHGNIELENACVRTVLCWRAFEWYPGTRVVVRAAKYLQVALNHEVQIPQ